MVIPLFENQQKTNEKTAYSFKGKSPENAKTWVRDVSLRCVRKNLRMHGIETPRYRASGDARYRMHRYRACIRRCMHGNETSRYRADPVPRRLGTVFLAVHLLCIFFESS